MTVGLVFVDELTNYNTICGVKDFQEFGPGSTKNSLDDSPITYDFVNFNNNRVRIAA
jgi:hypothetical protein